jgi:TatD DNase family protein
MYYYDIHTHRPRIDPNIVTIENIHQNFTQASEHLKVSMGLHPWHLNAENLRSELASLSQCAVSPAVVAIGECGLDKTISIPWIVQENAFKHQILLAVQLGKPLIIHCVRAFEEVLVLLRNVTVPVIFHGVNNKLTVVRKVIDHGYYLSFGKALLNNQQSIKETFRAVPMRQLFLETDDMETGIEEIYKSAALIKNIEEKEVFLQLENNFKTVFER